MREPEPAAGISAKKFVILVMEVAQAELMVVEDKSMWIKHRRRFDADWSNAIVSNPTKQAVSNTHPNHGPACFEA